MVSPPVHPSTPGNASVIQSDLGSNLRAWVCRREMMSHSWPWRRLGLRTGGSTLGRAHATQHMSTRNPSCHSGPARQFVTRPNPAQHGGWLSRVNGLRAHVNG